MTDDRVLLGRIVGVHGLDGGIRVAPESDRWRSWGQTLTRVYVERLGPDPVSVTEVRVARGFPVLRLVGISDRAAATALVGSRLWRPVEDLERLPDGQYWWHELVGLSVRDAEGQAVGRVDKIQPGPAHDWLLVRSGSRLHWIPFVAAWVDVIPEQGEVRLKRSEARELTD
jgi:16S rRNA processing protein RimM